MRTEKAKLEFGDSKLLEEVVNNYNWVYRNSSRHCDLRIGSYLIHEIEITDDGKLLPYGIFEIGRHIGYRLMYDNYRIRLSGWRKSFHQTIYEGEIFPQGESMTVKLKNDEENTFDIRKAAIQDAEIQTIMPFISKEDFGEIVQFSAFQETQQGNWTTRKTQHNLSINYLLAGNFLLIFGVDIRYGGNHYRVDLESAYEIQRPEHDF